MRVNAGFSRLLRLDGIWVRWVQFNADRVLVSVALRRRRLRCPLCVFSTPHRHNRQQVESAWRHLDLGVWRLELRAQLRRLECPDGATSSPPASRPTPTTRRTAETPYRRAWTAPSRATCRLVPRSLTATREGQWGLPLD
jgi:hypothetical protein